ncbi:KH domain-containing protein [Vitis vinifera]|uniref:KH domain-containing protein n=1 Tax=Vitis vinifera TaxID=29760 RepID=A0A438H9A1_VITVI|nr:KH domain-containing protein [Vitis vinifera]
MRVKCRLYVGEISVGTEVCDSGNKRRNPGDDRDPFTIEPEDTVYRYLCPGRKIGSIIGRGGEIVKQLRVDTKSKIRIGETVPGCEERVVTIYSSSDETNAFDDSDTFVSPAQDALFRVHDRVVSEEVHGEDSEEASQVTVRLLVPSDQIGCVIGKGGQIIQSIRSESGAQIRILKDDHLPSCALSSDELVQISGEPSLVRKALYQIASRLHDNPSRSQHLLASAVPTGYSSGGSLMGPTSGAPIMGLAPLVGTYGGYRGDSGDWSRSLTQPHEMRHLQRNFLFVWQESGAAIKVDSTSAAEADDCLIAISAKRAAVRLQPRCSEKVERDSGIVSFTTRLLVPTSRIGCLIGKGGAIITEMRKLTKANIRILSKENLPKVASEDDEMVQIAGDLDVAKDALIQVTTRLRANLFDREDNKRHGRGPSYSGGYGGSSDLAAADAYGGYGSQIGGSGSGYGAYVATLQDAVVVLGKEYFFSYFLLGIWSEPCFSAEKLWILEFDMGTAVVSALVYSKSKLFPACHFKLRVIKTNFSKQHGAGSFLLVQDSIERYVVDHSDACLKLYQCWRLIWIGIAISWDSISPMNNVLLGI